MKKETENMQQPNWDEAPALATHWCPETDSWEEGWYFVADPVIAVIEGRDRVDVRAIDQEDREELLPMLIPRPAAKTAPQAWNGEGLPPVGTACECRFAVEDFQHWHAGVCVAVGNSPEGIEVCVVQAGGTLAMYRSGDHIRPIRTPEQIANAALVEALEHARQFIRNGIDLGFIRMPDADTPDPAHETLPRIDAALSAHRAALAAERRRAEVSAADANDAKREARELAERLAAVTAERDQLRAEVEALRKDAELYQRLRDLSYDQVGAPGVPCVAVPSGPFSGVYVSGEDLDAIMAAKEGE